MYYVYILKSLAYSAQLYIGYTKNLDQRLKTHNSGGSLHTAKYKPWEVIVCISFKDEAAAISFEKYLKTGSGRVFMEKFIAYAKKLCLAQPALKVLI